MPKKFVNYAFHPAVYSPNLLKIFKPYPNYANRHDEPYFGTPNTIIITKERIYTDHYGGDYPDSFKDITEVDVRILSKALENQYISSSNSRLLKELTKEFIIWWLHEQI